MEQAKQRRVAPRAKPGTPRTPTAGDTGAPGKPLARPGEAAPDLLKAALMCNADQCPPEAAMQLCRMQETYWEGCCRECWENYLYWVKNDRQGDPYRVERLREN